MTMKSLLAASAVTLAIAGPAVADQASRILTSVPSSAATVSTIYKQSVYDPSDNKIGEVTDLVVQADGKIAAAMVGVGGFLGMGEKDVAVPFEALRQTTKNNKVYLVMDTTKDALKSAPSFRYDRSSGKWVPDTSTK
jgi:sporulation protein YlmC with PRC-barrel domain